MEGGGRRKREEGSARALTSAAFTHGIGRSVRLPQPGQTPPHAPATRPATRPAQIIVFIVYYTVSFGGFLFQIVFLM